MKWKPQPTTTTTIYYFCAILCLSKISSWLFTELSRGQAPRKLWFLIRKNFLTHDIQQELNVSSPPHFTFLRFQGCNQWYIKLLRLLNLFRVPQMQTWWFSRTGARCYKRKSKARQLKFIDEEKRQPWLRSKVLNKTSSQSSTIIWMRVFPVKMADDESRKEFSFRQCHFRFSLTSHENCFWTKFKFLVR